MTFTNSFEGPVTLELIGGKVVGLVADFDGATVEVPDRVTVQPKATGSLRFKYVPSPTTKPPDRLGMQVHVDPLNVMLPVELVFTE